MKLERIHWRLEQEWNKNSNNHRRYLSDLEKDEIINSSIFDYVEMFLHGHNPKGFDIGFEVTQQMIDMLDTLVVSYPEEPELIPSNLEEDFYRFNFSNTTKPYKSFVRGSIRIKDCNFTLSVNPEQHGDMGKILESYHRRPSKRWKNVPGVLEADSLIVNMGDLVPLGLRLTYIKKPARVALGTYTDVPTVDNPNPATLNKQECDLPEDYHDLLVRIAVQNLHRIYINPQGEILFDKKIKELT